MAAMDRETLVRILDHASGLSGKEPRFDVADNHRLRFYIGRPGRAMEVSAVRSVTVERDFIAIECDDEDVVYVAFEDVHAVAVRSNEPKKGHRAGFA